MIFVTSRAQCEHIGIAMDNDVNADVVEARFILVFSFFLIELSGNKKEEWQEREREEFANKISETGTCCVLAVDPYVF